MENKNEKLLKLSAKDEKGRKKQSVNGEMFN
jgi:hypothetical protein